MQNSNKHYIKINITTITLLCYNLGSNLHHP